MLLETQKRERLSQHLANIEFVANFYEHLRAIRGNRSQMLVACMADVAQSYISKVEAGITSGIGFYSLQRILDTYKEIEDGTYRHY